MFLLEYVISRWEQFGGQEYRTAEAAIAAAKRSCSEAAHVDVWDWTGVDYSKPCKGVHVARILRNGTVINAVTGEVTR